MNHCCVLRSFLLFLYLLFAVKSFSQNFSDFTWQHPQYGGHSLNEIKHVAGETFMAVGDQGMLLMSFNNGQTWTMNQIKTLRNLKAIQVHSPDDILVAGSYDNSGLELYRTLDGGDTWNLVYQNNAIGVNDMQFPSDSVGYMVGNIGKVLRTTDGGSTWLDISSVSINGSLQCVWFTSPDTGFAGRTTTFGMYKTTNGGITWSQNFGYYFTNCYSMYFLNDSVGFAGSNGNAIFRTTNRGANWSLQSNPQLSEFIRSFSFADSLRGMALAGGYIYRTLNGGSTWSSTFYTGNLRTGAMSSNGHAVVGNLTGGIRISSDYAGTFTDANPQSGNSTFRRIRFFGNSGTGWVAGDGGKVLKTSNNGNSWQLQTSAPYIDYPTDMAVLSPTRVLIGTEDGKILSTTNGGTSFSTQTLDGSGGPVKAIHFPNANTGYACGNSGKLWKSTNGGNSFTAINISGVTQNLIDLHFPSPNVGYVLDQFGQIRKTTNGGSSFTALSGNGITYSPKHIWFLNDDTGYILCDQGAVYRSTDGSNFEPAGNTCLQTPLDLYCLNDSSCFAVGGFNNASCDISYTTNRGETWNNLTFPYAYAGWGVHAIDTLAIWLVGQNQTIIRRGKNDLVTHMETPDKKDDTEVFLYPNPAGELATLQSNTPVESWKIFDTRGRLLLEGRSQALPIHLLDKGMYLVQVKHTNGKLSMVRGMRE
jgi:photosystem II stability/assembly factor-like uncharacterized protein